MVNKFFDKETVGNAVKNKRKQNKELAKELRKPIIRKLKKKKYNHFL